jgi:hypothetical protein
MLIVGYRFGIRFERRLCEEVHLNLAYRWFCRLGLDGRVPDHSMFSKNRHGCFRQSDLLRRLFETVLRRCIRESSVSTFNPAFRHAPRLPQKSHKAQQYSPSIRVRTPVHIACAHVVQGWYARPPSPNRASERP